MDKITMHILIDTPTRKKIRALFGCSHVAVWKALTFRSDSETSRKIRTVALESGGQRVGQKTLPASLKGRGVDGDCVTE